MSSYESISEESDYSSVSTTEMELMQHQDDVSSTMSEEEIEEPVRSVSPVMWKRKSPPSIQVAAQPIEVLPPAPTNDEILDHLTFGTPLRGHRIPINLLNVFSDRWVGTHNRQEFINVTERLQQACEDTNVAFMDVYREEAPTTGHVHYHSVVIFNRKKSAHNVIALDPYANWQPMRGQLITAWNYARKGADRAFTYGDMPLTLVNHLATLNRRQQTREGPTPAQERFNQMVARAKAGDESIRDEQLYARYQRYFDQILLSMFQPLIYEANLQDKNLWIWGPPGTGKSRLVHEYCRNNSIRCYNKLQNKWWDGYTTQEIVLIEDADPNTMKMLAAHMKVWSDRYPFTAEVKGTARMINANFNLVVTSNYSIDDCFNPVDAAAIKRRFDVLEMF